MLAKWPSSRVPTALWILIKLVATTPAQARLEEEIKEGQEALMKHDRWYAAGFSVFYLVFDTVKLPMLTLAKLMQSECLSIHKHCLFISKQLGLKIMQGVSHTNSLIDCVH